MCKIKKAILWSINEKSHLDSIFFFKAWCLEHSLAPEGRSLLFPLTSSERSQAYIQKPARGGGAVWCCLGQVVKRDFLFFQAWFFVLNQPPSLIQGQFVFPSLHRDHTALDSESWVLHGIWLTPDSRVYFYHPSGQICYWKQWVRESSDPLQQSKVHCIATLSLLQDIMLLADREAGAMLRIPVWFKNTAVCKVLGTF